MQYNPIPYLLAVEVLIFRPGIPKVHDRVLFCWLLTTGKSSLQKKIVEVTIMFPFCVCVCALVQKFPRLLRNTWLYSMEISLWGSFFLICGQLIQHAALEGSGFQIRCRQRIFGAVWKWNDEIRQSKKARDILRACSKYSCVTVLDFICYMLIKKNID